MMVVMVMMMMVVVMMMVMMMMVVMMMVVMMMVVMMVVMMMVMMVMMMRERERPILTICPFESIQTNTYKTTVAILNTMMTLTERVSK